jgi:4-hydroxy-tetrahydrodipicolinate reductase
MIRVIVAGGCGRIGGEVAKLISMTKDMKLSGILERKDHPEIGKPFYDVEVLSDISLLIDKADVVVDFTSPHALLDLLETLKELSVPVISGTTGLGTDDIAKLKEFSKNKAILWSPNMSTGVNLLFRLVEQAASSLRDYDVEILEMHHRHKKDAPSGTAKKLEEIVKRARRITKILYGREGITGERAEDELAVLALRAGDVAGEHTVFFATEGERLELTHRASSRLAFAKGTLKAIRFIVGRPKGFYEYSDILEEN